MSEPVLEIGIASYRSPEKLKRAIDSIYAMTEQSFKLTVWHNASEGDDAVLKVLDTVKCERTVSMNVGYAGAVNGLLAQSAAMYFAYCDNDVEIRTKGWDTRMLEVLDKHPEVAQVFPGSGHYGFFNGQYHECLWNAGYCWMLRKAAGPRVTGYPETCDTAEGYGKVMWMDTSLGHHEEVDLMIRLRLAGFQIACIPDVNVFHNETSTQSPESVKRIHRGVVSWMNKWNRYFCGEVFKYPNPDPDSKEGYDPRTLRYTDWPPCTLYLERMTLALFPEWNKSPRVVNVPGVGEMEAVEILKPKGCYVGRAI